MNRKKISTQFLAYFLVMMFLMVIGCSTNDDAAIYTISGTVSGDAVANVTINLTGAATDSATTDSDGNFSFASAANGTYTLTPSLTDYTFNPVSSIVVIDGANMTDVNFEATSTYGEDTYSISGTVTGKVQSDVKITLSGGGVTGKAMTGSDGTYTFANIVDGYSYAIVPSRSGYTFTPASANVTLSGGNVTDTDFVSSLSD